MMGIIYYSSLEIFWLSLSSSTVDVYYRYINT
jgi:hypothetical protein